MVFNPRSPTSAGLVSSLGFSLVLLACGDSASDGAGAGGAEVASSTASVASAVTTTTGGDTTSSSSVGSTTASGSSSSSGSPLACTPGETEPCYEGPAGTDGIGVCAAGTRTCLADGSGFDACLGQVLPTVESCANAIDDDCDGIVNQEGAGCVCAPGSSGSCYSGPPGTAGVAACIEGIAACNDEGTGWGPCVGEVLPMPETCNNAIDDDCDGQVNEEGDGCVCVPLSVASCYEGPAGTEGVGICVPGERVCDSLGQSYGPCVGWWGPTEESCIGLSDENCDGVTPVCTGDHLWSKGIPNWRVWPLAIDTLGNLIVGSSFLGTVDLGGGPLTSAGDFDIAIAKFDQAGGHIWSQRLGGINTDEVRALTADGDTTIFVGGLGQATDLGTGTPVGPGMFIRKIDASGATLWTKAIPNNGSIDGNDVAVDAQGNVFIVGNVRGNTDFGNGMAPTASESRAFVLKLTSSGVYAWHRVFTSTGLAQAYARGVAVDGSGNVVATGWFDGNINFGALSVSSDGTDAFTVKLDGDGTLLWSRRFGGSNSQQGMAVGIDSVDEVLLTGTFNGTVNFGNGGVSAQGTDMYVVKLDPSGTYRWAERYGSGEGVLPRKLAVDAADHVVVVGYSEGNVNFGNGIGQGDGNAFVVKLDPNGTHAWSRLVHGGFDTFAMSDGVAIDGSLNVYVGGNYNAPIDFGGGPLLPGPGFVAGFLVKLAP